MPETIRYEVPSYLTTGMKCKVKINKINYWTNKMRLKQKRNTRMVKLNSKVENLLEFRLLGMREL